MEDLPAYMSNRDYNNQFVQEIERIVPMCRHKKKWHLIFNTQSSAQADKYILDCDLAFFKPQGLLMADVERPNIRKIYKNIVDPYFENSSQDFIHRHACMVSRTYIGGIEIIKPPAKTEVIETVEVKAGVYAATNLSATSATEPVLVDVEEEDSDDDEK